MSDAAGAGTTHVPLEKISVVVLAGGRGTRISSLYPDTPKPMVPVRGEPFLYWLTRYLSDFGLSDFIYSTGYLAGQIDAWVENTRLPGVQRTTRREESPLGTGGGVLNCLDLCREWTLVANGDGLCMSGIPELLSIAKIGNLDGGLIGLRVDDTARYGSLSFGGDKILQSFREKMPGRGYINSGFYLFRTESLRRIVRDGASSLEQDLIPELLDKGCRFAVIPLEESAFIDIGTPETVVMAERFVDEHFPDARS